MNEAKKMQGGKLSVEGFVSRCGQMTIQQTLQTQQLFLGLNTFTTFNTFYHLNADLKKQ